MFYCIDSASHFHPLLVESADGSISNGNLIFPYFPDCPEINILELVLFHDGWFFFLTLIETFLDGGCGRDSGSLAEEKPISIHLLSHIAVVDQSVEISLASNQ